MINELIRDLERIGVEVLDAGSDEVMVSAESGEHLEYYPPFQHDPYVSKDLQDTMDDYDAYLEWESPGVAFIVLPY